MKDTSECVCVCVCVYIRMPVCSVTMLSCQLIQGSLVSNEVTIESVPGVSPFFTDGTTFMCRPGLP